jgi:PAS domain S-box-containing protein
MTDLADEVQYLRHYIRDLTAFTTLPALWTGREPREIAESLADVLLRALGLDIVYVCVKGSPDKIAMRIARTEWQSNDADHAQAIRKALAPWLKAANSSPPSSISIPNPTGSGMIQLATTPIGYEGEYGVVATSAQRADFPTELDRLLLNVGANQVAIWLQGARLLADLREADRFKDEMLAREQAARVELQRSTSELVEWKNRYEAAVQATGQLLYDWNSQTQQILWEGQTEQILGYSLEEIPSTLVGKMALVHPDDRDAFTAESERVSATRTPFQLEYRMRRKDGAFITVEDKGRFFLDSVGNTVRMVGFVVDITARKQAADVLTQHARELERLNADLRQIAYIAAHDLQEPVRQVSLYTQKLAKYDGADPEASEAMGFVMEGAWRMTAQLHDLLSYLEVDGMGPGIVLTDAEAVFRQAVEHLQKQIFSSGAAVTHDRLPTLDANAAHLQLVFHHLLDNALKFHGSTSPRVHVWAEHEADAWRFAVRDYGIGIDPQGARQLFGFFKRLERDRYPGTGMGLAICKKVVERYGGRIWIDSTLGQETTVYFTVRDSTKREGEETMRKRE